MFNIPHRHVYIILFAFIAAVTATSLHHSFIHMDDYTLIVDNPQIDLPLTRWPHLFTQALGQYSDSPGYSGTYPYYRPFLSLYFIINNKIWGINPVGFHLTSIGFHFLNAVLVFLLGLLLFDNQRVPAFIASALFAVHPAYNEILGRAAINDCIFGSFFLLTLYLYLRDKKIAAFISFVVALFLKETAIMLPFPLFLFALRTERVNKAFRSVIPYTITVTAFLILRSLVLGFSDNSGVILHDIPSKILALAYYLRFSIFPYPFQPFYLAQKHDSWIEAPILLAIGVIIIVMSVTWMIRRDKTMRALWLSFFILLIPAIIYANNMYLEGERVFVTERQLYLPLAFLILFLSQAVVSRFDNHRLYTLSAFIIVLLFFSGMTIYESRVWANDSTVYNRYMRDYPDTDVAHARRGNLLALRGNYEEALKEYDAILQGGRDIQQRTVEQQNKGEQQSMTVQSAFTELKGYDPNYAKWHYNMGRIYYAMKKYDRAARKFKCAVILQPYYADARIYLAASYMQLHKYSEASKEYKKIIDDVGGRRIYQP